MWLITLIAFVNFGCENDKNKETDKQTSQIPEINTMKKPKPAKIFEPSPNREDLDMMSTRICSVVGINVKWWENPPYIYQKENKVIGLLPTLLQSVADTCCRKRVNVIYHKPSPTEYDLIKNIDISNGSYIMVPLTGTMNQRTLCGNSYIPLIESPGILYLLDEEKVLRSLDFSLIYSVSKLWPLLLFIYIGAAIFGMIVWALDCYRNPQQFPVSFLEGSWKGFWWACVTMTTVGYGDRTPKSLSARLFALFWITIGVVTVALFNANMTSQLTALSFSSKHYFYGEKVAVLANSVVGKFASSKNVQVLPVPTASELKSHLSKDKDVDGALMDIYKAGYYKDILQGKDKIRVHKVIEHLFSYGLVIGGKDKDNVFENCIWQYLSLNEGKITMAFMRNATFLELPHSSTIEMRSRNLLNPNSLVFQYVMLVCGGFTLLFMAFSIMWYLWRQSKPIRTEISNLDFHESDVQKPVLDCLIYQQCLEIETAMIKEVDRFIMSWETKKRMILEGNVCFSPDDNSFTKQ